MICRMLMSTRPYPTFKSPPPEPEDASPPSSRHRGRTDAFSTTILITSPLATLFKPCRSNSLSQHAVVGGLFVTGAVLTTKLSSMFVHWPQKKDVFIMLQSFVTRFLRGMGIRRLEGPKVKVKEKEKKKEEGEERKDEVGSCSDSSGSTSTLPDMDMLKEELSCDICLDIYFEPSTTTCGHSFCRKCLSSAANKCGSRCPKCRQLISKVGSCTLNTVLWNTVQLLFPAEVEARKALPSI